MATEDSPELMTVKETAEYLRIPLPTVYYLVQRGQLPAIQIGGRWRIKRSLLDTEVLLFSLNGFFLVIAQIIFLRSNLFFASFEIAKCPL